MSDELENKLVGAIAMGELSGYWAGEYKDAMLKIKDLERQRDELVKLLKQVHLSGDCEWLYAEYGEVEWLADRLGAEAVLMTEYDSRGKYGRVLGTFYKDGVDVNRQMLDEGMAEVYE